MTPEAMYTGVHRIKEQLTDDLVHVIDILVGMYEDGLQGWAPVSRLLSRSLVGYSRETLKAESLQLVP